MISPWSCMCNMKEEFFGGGIFKSYTTSEAPCEPPRLPVNLRGSDKTDEAHSWLELTSEAHIKYFRLRPTIGLSTFYLPLEDGKWKPDNDLQSFNQLDKSIDMERVQFLCNECGKYFVDDVKLGLHQYAVHTKKLLNVHSVVRRKAGCKSLKSTCLLNWDWYSYCVKYDILSHETELQK